MRNTLLLVAMIAGFHSGVFCQTPIRSGKAPLDSLTRAVNSGQYDGINSILISHRSKTVYESYFGGWTKDSLHDSRSAFKSITGLLMGIAIDRGYIRNVQQKVYPFFPEYRNFTGKDSLKRNMTIKDLLNMTAGLDCEEFNDGKDCESDMFLTKDWVKFSWRFQ